MLENRIEKNICLFCAYSVGANIWGLGMVDCPVVGLGNCRRSQCRHYRENERLLALLNAAAAAIREFERLRETVGSHSMRLQKAAARSCALQEAIAIILDVSYDEAAQYCHERISGGGLEHEMDQRAGAAAEDL